MSKKLEQVPNMAPRIGNAFTRFIGRMLLRSIGYKVEGKFANEPKMIMIAAPHTSNWDLIIALGTILSLGVRINFMMKKSAFFFPFKNLFMALGGMPIDRANPKATVKQIIRTFEKRDQFWYAILPEGTRKPVDTWKAGFIRIARKANVPVYMMGLDARTKTLHLDKLVLSVEDLNDKPTGFAIEQAEELRLYAQEKFHGINPENH